MKSNAAWSFVVNGRFLVHERADLRHEWKNGKELPIVGKVHEK